LLESIIDFLSSKLWVIFTANVGFFASLGCAIKLLWPKRPKILLHDASIRCLLIRSPKPKFRIWLNGVLSNSGQANCSITGIDVALKHLSLPEKISDEKLELPLHLPITESRKIFAVCNCDAITDQPIAPATLELFIKLETAKTIKIKVPVLNFEFAEKDPATDW